MESDLNTPPKGLICPLVTPLKKDTLLDTGALENLIRHVSPDVDGIVVGDMIYGEGVSLSRKTRLDLFTSALEMIRGKRPVFVAVTSENPGDTIDLLEETEAFSRRIKYPGPLY